MDKKNINELFFQVIFTLFVYNGKYLQYHIMFSVYVNVLITIL